MTVSGLRTAVGIVALSTLSALPTRAPAAYQSPAASQQSESPADNRYAGLQWRFVRIKYHFATEGTRIPQDFYGEPWGIDAPAAEQNLSRRVKTATAIQVQEPILMTLDDPRLFQSPWIYFVEPSSMRMTEK